MQQIALRLAAGQVNHGPGRLCILAKEGHYAEPPGRVHSFPTPADRMWAARGEPEWVGRRGGGTRDTAFTYARGSSEEFHGHVEVRQRPWRTE